MALSPLARNVLRSRATQLAPQNLQTLEHYAQIVDQRRIAGDFVECGLDLGGSAVLMVSLLSEGRFFRGYDLDTRSSSQGKPEDWEDLVAHSLAAFGFPADGRRVSLRRAVIGRTLPGDEGRPVALAHINSEWPKAGTFYLRSIAPLMARGGFILIEERDEETDFKAITDRFLAERRSFSLVSNRWGSIVLRCTWSKFSK
jgi:asparagine synthase (glutamine-hydrolysing)